MQDPLQLMISTGKSRSFSKYEFLINSGEVSKNIYYIKEGVIRHFVNDSEGNEKTIRISKENDFFYSSIVSYFREEPTYINCQAMTNTYVIFWEKEQIEALMESNEMLRSYQYKQLVNFIIEKHNKELSLLTKTSIERLMEFNESNISLFNRIPHHVIASYLNMTPETLSRLRSQVKS